jgi:hypothetical protein
MSDLTFGVATGAHRRIDGGSGEPVAYDLRTGTELAAARMDDHQARIAALEARLRHVEVLLHRCINTMHDEHGRRICTDDYGDAVQSAVSV